MSKITTTTQVDTDSKKYDDTECIVTPRKHNQIKPEIPDTTTTTTLVQATGNYRLLQMSYSTSITPLKLPPYGKEYLWFHSDGKSAHAA